MSVFESLDFALFFLIIITAASKTPSKARPPTAKVSSWPKPGIRKPSDFFANLGGFAAGGGSTAAGGQALLVEVAQLFLQPPYRLAVVAKITANWLT